MERLDEIMNITTGKSFLSRIVLWKKMHDTMTPQNIQFKLEVVLLNYRFRALIRDC